MRFIASLFIYAIFVMVFCLLSIAYKGVEEQDAGKGLGQRWYAIVIFVYVLLVKLSIT
jgi:hypothetical protein